MEKEKHDMEDCGTTLQGYDGEIITPGMTKDYGKDKVPQEKAKPN